MLNNNSNNNMRARPCFKILDTMLERFFYALELVNELVGDTIKHVSEFMLRIIDN